jgi:hypothetical protein
MPNKDYSGILEVSINLPFVEDDTNPLMILIAYEGVSFFIWEMIYMQ